ncbi:MAG: DNA gyrase inhibitor YacG [bacterium]|nr:DNA gyrase inhibitor YacG [bacterium]
MITKSPACPICRKPKTVSDHSPFCSKRCQLVDLNRWVSGSYAIPTEEVATPEEVEKFSSASGQDG